MAQIIEFIGNHWLLCIALVVVLGMVIAYEMQTNSAQGFVNVQKAIALINHDNAIVIDIREKQAFKDGHIINAINCQSDNMSKMNQYKNKKIIIVCSNGQQAIQLSTKLKGADFKEVYVLRGGMTAWKSDDLPVAT